MIAYSYKHPETGEEVKTSTVCLGNRMLFLSSEMHNAKDKASSYYAALEAECKAVANLLRERGELSDG